MNLGIDESNNGKIPEVYVCCYSNNAIHEQKGNFNKKRNKNNRQLKLPYIHMLFYQDDIEIIEKKNIPIVAVCEFAKYVNNIEYLKKIYIDGKILDPQIKTIDRIVHSLKNEVEIINKEQLDEKVFIVNEADNTANLLYRYYSRKGTANKKYADNLIKPRFEEYLDFLPRAEKH